MSEEVAIKVNAISKIYKLYKKPGDRIRDSLGLTKKKLYVDHYALQNVSFDVNKGQCVGIIGTNGAGKSTLLKIITGVLAPTTGDITINGRISALLELGAGFNVEYTGIQNIYLNGMMIGFSKEEIDAKLESIVSFADIGEFINQPVKTYSSGMFVRLAFAVAINIDPEILIVDEALSVGDVFFQAKCYNKFEEFKKQGKTILFVSHDLGSVQKYCETVIVLDKGKKIAEGSPKDMIDLYKKLLVGQYGVDYKAGTDGAGSNQVKQDQVWKEKIVLNGNTNEYGDGRATIIDFGIFDESGNITTLIEKGRDFSIKMKIRFSETIRDPIFAFAIKDIHGTTLTGSNTMYEKYNTGTCEKGQIIDVAYTMRMNLQGGEYLLSLGCTGYEQGELTVYHRLYDVCNISVIADKVTDGYYDMYPLLEVKKL